MALRGHLGPTRGRGQAVSTNFQTGRLALGVRLRELRTEAGLTGRDLARALDWLPSKVSKLEHGRQTPTVGDVKAWAVASGCPATADELVARLRALETHYASWRRQLAAGTRARQEAWHADEAQSGTVWNFETACIPGLLQTADYARSMFERVTALYSTPPDVDDGVRARLRRQQALYEPGRAFHFLVWEAALRSLMCPPPVLASQLDRLIGVGGLPSVTLGVVPFAAPLPLVPSHGFWVFDERLVMVETIGAELRLVDETEVALYKDVWQHLAGVAAYGRDAVRLIAAARDAVDASP